MPAKEKKGCGCPHCEVKQKNGCFNSGVCGPCAIEKDENIKVCRKCKAEYGAQYEECPSCSASKE